jgi:ATP-dependent RNA helicase UAP56/SUB2
MSSHDNDELIDYEDEGDVVSNGATLAAGAGAADDDKEKKNFSGIHSTGFRLVILFRFFFLIFTDHREVISC